MTQPVPAEIATPRQLHPVAWWVWALGLAVATTRTENPMLTALIVAAVMTVVFLCRDDSPWARAFVGYLVLGVVIIAIRVVFYVLVGVKTGGPTLLAIPRITLPEWTGSLTLLGPVSISGIVAAAASGFQLAALIVCVGAANALANPKRVLRSLPTSLHQLGTAVVIAVTLAPQLVGSWLRVRRARVLRGRRFRGFATVLSTAMPVLQDALDQALALAASMDSRGYARVRPGRSGRAMLPLMLAALLAMALGTYSMLDASIPLPWGVVAIVVAAAAAAAGSIVASRQLQHTRYRPDRWRIQESLVAGAGIVVAVFVSVLDAAGSSVTWLVWTLCSLIALIPAVLVPWHTR
ncbi:MAG: energy-coupling factor transporter transmembrane protein EcfT [Terrimesophilobacter sp.]